MTNLIDALTVNTLRTLAIDAIQKADSGHPGLPLGAAPLGYVLWHRHLKHCPSDPHWPDRDRFVLSAGHGSMLLYGLLHLTGYDLTLDDIRAFRQWDARTPGHPEYGLTPGVEATTGPLGQGHANAVGMAMAERALAARFNQPGFTLFDHHTYALVGDGCLMEGVAAEAASLAGHLKLGKLIVMYDSNDVTLDGPTDLSFTEDVGARYRSYGWQVLTVEKGDTDLSGIDAALTAAKADTEHPSLIIIRTTIGFGSPKKAGSAQAHGSPLGVDEVAATKKALGWTASEPFFVPKEVRAHLDKRLVEQRSTYENWNEMRERYRAAHPELEAELRRVLASELPPNLAKATPTFDPAKPLETRTAAGEALNAFAAVMPELLGGDADLASSTKTTIKGGGDFNGQTGKGRNIHFGVREHAMAAIANGMCYHGGVRPYVSTFFCFVDYLRPAARLAAMNHLPVIHVWTHDSIALGEDGPTHQPVEHLMAMRAIPNFVVMRPADAAEAAEAWFFALERVDGPTGLVLTRQKVPTLDRSTLAPATGLHRGAYVLSEAKGGEPEAIIIATGSEVALALEAQKVLTAEGKRVRVVSMPSMGVFARQERSYHEAVLPAKVRARVSVEAGITWGWERWVGEAGVSIGVNEFGASAPERELTSRFGLTATAVVKAVHRCLPR